MTDLIVTRLYQALVEELQQRGHPFDRPVTVASLYEEIVPYRSVRRRLGVELNADYEHAMLRLLAGEQGLLRLEPEDARNELRREAAAPYPTVGLFRQFSASSAWVRPPDGAVGQDAGEEAVELPESPDEPPARDRGPRLVREQGTGTRPAAERNGGARPAERPEPGEMPGRACAFCGGALPEGRPVRFCPHCGEGQGRRPCPECGAVLEEEWQYCVRCGQAAADRE